MQQRCKHLPVNPFGASIRRSMVEAEGKRNLRIPSTRRDALEWKVYAHPSALLRNHREASPVRCPVPPQLRVDAPKRANPALRVVDVHPPRERPKAHFVFILRAQRACLVLVRARERVRLFLVRVCRDAVGLGGASGRAAPAGLVVIVLCRIVIASISALLLCFCGGARVQRRDVGVGVRGWFVVWVLGEAGEADGGAEDVRAEELAREERADKGLAHDLDPVRRRGALLHADAQAVDAHVRPWTSSETEEEGEEPEDGFERRGGYVAAGGGIEDVARGDGKPARVVGAREEESPGDRGCCVFERVGFVV